MTETRKGPLTWSWSHQERSPYDPVDRINTSFSSDLLMLPTQEQRAWTPALESMQLSVLGPRARRTANGRVSLVYRWKSCVKQMAALLSAVTLPPKKILFQYISCLPAFYLISPGARVPMAPNTTVAFEQRSLVWPMVAWRRLQDHKPTLLVLFRAGTATSVNSLSLLWEVAGNHWQTSVAHSQGPPTVNGMAVIPNKCRVQLEGWGARLLFTPKFFKKISVQLFSFLCPRSHISYFDQPRWTALNHWEWVNPLSVIHVHH